MKKVKIENYQIEISNELPIVFIAGTCVIESFENYYLTLKELKEITAKIGVNFIAKASFDKANRSSLNSFRGPGIKEGIEILKEIKKKLNLPILVDIHLPQQAEIVAEVCDIIQIPAFLCRQTDILLAAADTKKVINVKKGQFIAPWDVKNIVKKIESRGNESILITERGYMFGYNNLVVDIRSFDIIKKECQYPVIYDATHSVQKPGGLGDRSGGEREFILSLSKAAISCSIAGVFFETHIDPENALSDGPNSIPLKEAESFISTLTKLDKFVKSIL
ncbi:MAG: 3-deoxy-8-phosphooctulonate synthase [Elusimicrobiales bacterium]|nr:3-deoxy-8-phosphooctulonate synthase [Elusimicrobiales bacterium]